MITNEMWEGIWLPTTKSWCELGLDINDFPPSAMAPDVGQVPIDCGDFLRFLLAVRGIDSYAPGQYILPAMLRDVSRQRPAQSIDAAAALRSG